MRIDIPDISKQIYAEEVYKAIVNSYDEIGPIWSQHQMEWCNNVYSTFKDHEKFLIIIYLIHKTLNFYSKNLTLLTYEEFYTKETVEIEKFNVIELSKKLFIPKESARRKVIELQKIGVLKKVKKKFIIDRSAYPFMKPSHSIKRVSRFLSALSSKLENENVLNKTMKTEEVEKIIKGRFTISWKLWYDMQIPMLLSWKRIFNDLETWHLWGVCAINQTYEQSKNSNIKMDRLQYWKAVTDPDQKFRGLNAMSLSEISGIPRATVVRKLNKLLKAKHLKKNDKKHYLLTGIHLKEMFDVNKATLKGLSKFSTEIYNFSLVNKA